MDIRSLRRGEEDAFIKMALASWRDAYVDILPKETIKVAPEMMATAVEKRFSEFRVAARGSALLGFYSLGEENYLWHLYVDPSCFRQGIGKALLNAAEADIKARGFSTVALDVTKGNDRAVAFYEAMGFVVTGTDEDGDVLMEKEL